MKEQKTADFIKERYPFYDEDLTTRDVELNGEEVRELMQSYSDQQNAGLRDRIRELENEMSREIDLLHMGVHELITNARIDLTKILIGFDKYEAVDRLLYDLDVKQGKLMDELNDKIKNTSK